MSESEFKFKEKFDMELTWEQKLQAIASLHGILDKPSLMMNEPGNWYIYLPALDIKKGCMLTSPCNRGNTPEDAVNSAWDNLTKLKDDEYLVVNAFRDSRKAVKWNGFMWQEISEEIH